MKRGSIVICVNEGDDIDLTLYKEYKVLHYDEDFRLVSIRNDTRKITAYHKERFILKEEGEDNMKKENKKEEMVSHPSHYTQHTYEPIDVIEDWDLGFSLGNAVKYIARANYKWNKIEDLKKAIFYIQYEINKLEKKEEEE